VKVRIVIEFVLLYGLIFVIALFLKKNLKVLYYSEYIWFMLSFIITILYTCTRIHHKIVEHHIVLYILDIKFK